MKTFSPHLHSLLPTESKNHWWKSRRKSVKPEILLPESRWCKFISNPEANQAAILLQHRGRRAGREKNQWLSQPTEGKAALSTFSWMRVANKGISHLQHLCFSRVTGNDFSQPSAQQTFAAGQTCIGLDRQHIPFISALSLVRNRGRNSGFGLPSVDSTMKSSKEEAL